MTTLSSTASAKKSKFIKYNLQNSWHGLNILIAELRHRVHGEDPEDEEIFPLFGQIDDIETKMTAVQSDYFVGTRVRRIASDYTGGRFGDIIEIDAEKKRARVIWVGRINDLIKKEAITMDWAESSWICTWVKFTSLQIL